MYGLYLTRKIIIEPIKKIEYMGEIQGHIYKTFHFFYINPTFENPLKVKKPHFNLIRKRILNSQAQLLR